MVNKVFGALLLCIPLLLWLAFMIFEFFGVEGVFIFAGGLALGAAIILCVVVGVWLDY